MGLVCKHDVRPCVVLSIGVQAIVVTPLQLMLAQHARLERGMQVTSKGEWTTNDIQYKHANSSPPIATLNGRSFAATG